MSEISLFIDSTEITNETQLSFQEHKVQEMITKQIASEYGVADIILIIGMVIALGAMVFSYFAITAEKPKYIIMVVLAVCLGYASYAQCKIWKDGIKLQNQISQTMCTINCYKELQKPKDKLEGNQE